MKKSKPFLLLNSRAHARACTRDFITFLLENQISTLDELIKNLDKELDNKVDKVIYKVPVLDAEGNPTYDENG